MEACKLSHRATSSTEAVYKPYEVRIQGTPPTLSFRWLLQVGMNCPLRCVLWKELALLKSWWHSEYRTSCDTSLLAALLYRMLPLCFWPSFSSKHFLSHWVGRMVSYYLLCWEEIKVPNEGQMYHLNMALSDCLPLGLHCGNWKWLPGKLNVIFVCEFCTLQPKFIKKILLLGEGIFFLWISYSPKYLGSKWSTFFLLLWKWCHWLFFLLNVFCNSTRIHPVTGRNRYSCFSLEYYTEDSYYLREQGRWRGIWISMEWKIISAVIFSG